MDNTMYTKLIFLVFACIIEISEELPKDLIKEDKQIPINERSCTWNNPISSRLRCYACSFSSVDTDQSCLTITNSTNRVECTMKYCTIMRQEYRDPVNEVASFIRGCEDSPDFLNHQIEDSTFRTFYRACTSDLCNIGDGIQSVVGGNLAPRPPFNGSNLFVPGTGSAVIKQIDLFIFIIASCTIYFLM